MSCHLFLLYPGSSVRSLSILSITSNICLEITDTCARALRTRRYSSLFLRSSVSLPGGIDISRVLPRWIQLKTIFRCNSPLAHAQDGFPHFLAISYTLPLTRGHRPYTTLRVRSSSFTRHRKSWRRRLRVCWADSFCMLLTIITYRLSQVKIKIIGLKEK